MAAARQDHSAERRPCPRLDCARLIGPTSFSCFADWRLLPKGLRKKINRPPTGETNQMQMVKALRVWTEDSDGLR